MPVSISEQGACDTAATRVKACTKTASSSLCFAQEGTGGARFSETEGVKNPVEMHASVNADTWCKMEMFGSPSNSRIHSTQSLRAAKSFCHTGTFWKIPGVQQSKAKKKKNALDKDGGLINIPAFVWCSPESRVLASDGCLRTWICWRIPQCRRGKWTLMNFSKVFNPTTSTV